MKGVLRYLEDATKNYPNKVAVIDEKKSLLYWELRACVYKIGQSLDGFVQTGKPVAVFMEKGVDALCAFFGIVCAGGCYTMLNPELPEARIQQIVSVLEPNVIITDDDLFDRAQMIFKGYKILKVQELLENQEREQARRIIDTDPLYINFTSGSTGVPKGIVVSHRSVVDFIDCFTETFSIGSEDVIANQAPFDFDVSVKDIYSAMKTGATLVIVPRRMFSAPVELVEYLCKHNVTTMIWAVSALGLINTFHALEYKTPKTVNKILFSGEVMPLKHLLGFKKHLPDAMYVNLYGPTEITCNCTYHILDVERDYTAGIPIGKAFENEDVFLLNDKDELITAPNEVGEICVRGTALALGYYSSEKQNKEHFVQNPLNDKYPELIYRTGDLARYDENEDLIFSGRKDFQIKYMGHRVELEEIERAIAAIDGVEQCCCVFEEKRSRLKGYYVGEIEKDKLFSIMKETLPSYMIPGTVSKLTEMPLTKNGKTDRKLLAEMVGGARKNG